MHVSVEVQFLEECAEVLKNLVYTQREIAEIEAQPSREVRDEERLQELYDALDAHFENADRLISR